MKQKPRIAVFAGANAPDRYNDLAFNIGMSLADQGFVTITGGGPGMMRAVNRGAFQAGGISWGICIKHRQEQIIPDFFHHHEVYERFDERNDRLLSLGDAFVVLPGGLGTIVEALQITQRKKFHEIHPTTPLLFVGDFYEPLTHIFKKIEDEGFISDNLDKLYTFVETAEQMCEHLNRYFRQAGKK
jgi:uncharacterized protein (TIGR00730 family)